MAGLQFGSMNSKDTNKYVSDATLRLLNIYQARNHVSDETLENLRNEILLGAGDAYEFAHSNFQAPKHTPEKIHAEYNRFLETQNLNTKNVIVVSARVASSSDNLELISSVPPKTYEIPSLPRTRGRARKLRPMVNGHELPKKVTSVDETISLKWIICLEDGKKVKDLAYHLGLMGLTPSQYRKKWGLSASYPMHAPQMILQRGATFEVDYTSGIRRRVRS